MKKIIAFCGIICYECPAFIATKNDNDIERKKVAEQWSKEFNAEIKPEDINCNGCLSKTEPLFSHCKVCEIRFCGLEKGIKNCAYCDEFACEKLNKFFEFLPSAKIILKKIREDR
ncbi:MAG: DUF3795 domain-containing protein [Candidatus Cloacimonetes bacterium]|nr:DUF3795 domain-containing protein [Candidatus Cloacimonadota bacterium]